ncbi:MAG: tRNA (adenosine(37)-N6)-threonylcarbamoyltransferase complex ATPase subunit type 1 TsaE [Xanthomonadales bacterium]|nr:tRNA (adenosine(37)-N6)-threonylcarbamoyltransferase complex ATPase subunit type 1 TsaE [Xanthomonadales bacterium]
MTVAGHLPDENALELLAQRLHAAAGQSLAIALEGPLGAGKTSFARALLRSLGHAGPVRSPTYTLVEQYPLAQGQVWHLDLYRLGSPEEADWLGLHDFEPDQDWLLVEWPQRAADHLPGLDLRLVLDYADPGRDYQIEALSARGQRLLRSLAAS